MPIMGEYFPPGTAPAPCCAGCASPAERQALRRRGAGAVAAAVLARRGARGALGASEDPLIWWPGDIKALAARTDTEIWAVAKDYSSARAQGAISDTVLQNFKAFYNEWATYRDQLGFSDWLTGSTATMLQQYRKRLDAYRQHLVGTGARVESTPIVNLPAKPYDWGTAAKWGAAAAIAVGGAVAVGHVARLVGPLLPRRRATP